MARTPLLTMHDSARGDATLREDDSRKQTPAEVAVGMIPVNYAYAPGLTGRWNAKGTGTDDDTAAIQKALDLSEGYFGITRTADKKDIPMVFIPGGAYLITGAGLTVPDGIHLMLANDAVFFYDDTGSTGSYCLNLGAAGANHGYLTIDGLYILLRTLTANGLSIMNCIDSTYNNVRIEGFSGSYATRTNTAVKIDSDGGDCFYNDFYGLKLSHIHRGVYCPTGGIGTRQNFYGVRMSGDGAAGDTDGIGLEIEDCPGSTVHNAYFENFAGACIQLTGNRASRWRFRDTLYDFGGLGSMVGLKILKTGSPESRPTGNRFESQWWYPGATVVDETIASDRNFISGNPSAPGSAWTPVLSPETGSVTPNGAVTGAWCICDGNRVHVWGRILVTSVSSPTGRLFIEGLPFPSADYEANYVAFPVKVSDLNTSAATSMQGVIEKNSTRIEIEHFAAGAAGGAGADIKSGSDVIFSAHYVTDEPDA
jgi:hypothetical protein